MALLKLKTEGANPTGLPRGSLRCLLRSENVRLHGASPWHLVICLKPPE